MFCSLITDGTKAILQVLVTGALESLSKRVQTVFGCDFNIYRSDPSKPLTHCNLGTGSDEPLGLSYAGGGFARTESQFVQYRRQFCLAGEV
jgi:hypothetical protein